MSKLPMVNFKTMDKLLHRLAFTAARQKGESRFLSAPDGRTTTLPHHGNRDIALPLMREILREISTSPDEFVELLEEL